jgi:Ala-tRNA(Pro) deacylase
MPLSSLREYLDKHSVQYIVISHSLAYTAQGVAALTHTPGKELAKTVKKETMAKVVELASETDFKDRFPECETGAMPPFGNLYGMDVFVDESLAQDKEIAFNAGSHRELIRLPWADFERLVKPRIIRITRGKTAEAA